MPARVAGAVAPAGLGVARPRPGRQSTTWTKAVTGRPASVRRDEPALGAVAAGGARGSAGSRPAPPASPCSKSSDRHVLAAPARRLRSRRRRSAPARRPQPSASDAAQRIREAIARASAAPGTRTPAATSADEQQRRRAAASPTHSTVACPRSVAHAARRHEPHSSCSRRALRPARRPSSATAGGGGLEVLDLGRDVRRRLSWRRRRASRCSARRRGRCRCRRSRG